VAWRKSFSKGAVELTWKKQKKKKTYRKVKGKERDWAGDTSRRREKRKLPASSAVWDEKNGKERSQPRRQRPSKGRAHRGD